jgi:hypothetical protein
MKKYKHTLKLYENECNLKTMILILKQLLLIQLDLFNKYQFVQRKVKLFSQELIPSGLVVHNDIHLGNVFIE